MSNPRMEYKTRCRVPGCKKTFVSDPFDVPIIGQPGERIVKFVSALYEHVAKNHPDRIQQINGAVQQYLGFMAVSLFELEDPQLLAMREAIRASLHMFTRRMVITDAEIADRVARLELDPDKEEDTQMLLRDMRDLLTDSGRYAPKIEDKPAIVNGTGLVTA
jgi:hypothetical protein